MVSGRVESAAAVRSISSRMGNDTFLYFAYGSNLLSKRIHIQNPTAERRGIGRLMVSSFISTKVQVIFSDKFMAYLLCLPWHCNASESVSGPKESPSTLMSTLHHKCYVVLFLQPWLRSSARVATCNGSGRIIILWYTGYFKHIPKYYAPKTDYANFDYLGQRVVIFVLAIELVSTKDYI